MTKRFSVLQIILFMMLAASATMVITYYATFNGISKQLVNVTASQEVFIKLAEVKRSVENNFVGDYNADDLIDGAVAGYVGALGDKWSYYLTADEYQQRIDQLKGGYTGIGVRIIYNDSDKALKIVEVFNGSAAKTAGLQISDEITAVEGKTVAELGLKEAQALILGQAGSTVQITVTRGGVAKDYTLTRNFVEQKNLNYKMLDNKVAYIQVKEFADGIEKEFISAVNTCEKNGAKSYIFDMRNNPGGSLDSLIAMLDRILPKCVLFIQQDKSGNTKKYNSDATCLSAPMAVLVNEDTYSAAEYFAAVLQEYGKATIIGQKTTGKGYGQIAIPLSDGSAIVLSTIRYFTPQNRSLALTGCIPDYVVGLNDNLVPYIGQLGTDKDTQLAKAVEILTK